MYTEFQPPHALRQHVLCFWHEVIDEETQGPRVLPDGCVDIVWMDHGSAVVAGPNTYPVVHSLAPATELVGVRFRPGTAHRVLGVPIRELVNSDAPLASLWNRKEGAEWDVLGETETVEDQFKAIARSVQERLALMPETDAFASKAAIWIARHCFGPVRELEELSGYSERQILRKFQEAVGYGPKQLQRILRLQFWLWLARQAENRQSLADLACLAGYADQPHLSREVRRLTGRSPAMVLYGDGARTTVSDLFKTPRTGQWQS